MFASIGARDFPAELPRLRGTRSLVIHGESDPIPISTARETAELIGARLHAIPRCGHAPFVEARDELMTVLREFIRAP